MIIDGTKASFLALGTAVYRGGEREADAFRLMDVYRECGGNIFDTARVYGESESVIGRYLKARGCRGEVLISTKGGHYDLVTKEKRIRREAIYSDVEVSFKDLGIDYADIYWLHRDDVDIPVAEIMGILADLVREGKILSIGVSNWTVERIAEANKFARENGLPRIIASQIKHSAAVTVQENDPTMLSLDEVSREFYEREKTAIFAYTAQAKGVFSKLERLGVDGISEGLRREFICDETLRRYDVMRDIASELGRPIGQVALAALLCDPGLDIIPIIGGRTPEQIEDSFAALDIKLSREQFEKIMKTNK